MRLTDVFNAKNQDTLHDTALTSDVMNVMNMDILSWTVLTKYPLQGHWHHFTRHIEIATPDQALDTAKKIEEEEMGPDHSLDIADITAPAIMTCTKATPDHNSGTESAITEAPQDNPIQHTEDTVTDPTMTHNTGHTANHPHTAAHQVTTLRTAVDHIHVDPLDHVNITHIKKDQAVEIILKSGNPEITPKKENEGPDR